MSALSYEETLAHLPIQPRIVLFLHKPNNKEMDMTEYELVDVLISYNTAAMSALALYLTTVSGYLIVAYLVRVSEISEGFPPHSDHII
jgi:hypothetical protein